MSRIVMRMIRIGNLKVSATDCFIKGLEVRTLAEKFQTEYFDYFIIFSTRATTPQECSETGELFK